MTRTLLRSVVRLLFRLLGRLDIQGLEKIPAQGGAILAVNHLGILDAPLVFIAMDRRDVTSLVADTYKGNPFIHWLVEAVNGIWINRGEPDLHALRAARNWLQNGGLLGIAPEGTRSRTGALIHAKTGVAYLAAQANVPIVPVAIWGTEDAVSRLFHFHRPPVHLHVGQPFTLPSLDRRDRNHSLQQNTDEIMCQIARMLPEHYHGVYAGHPRLAELSAGELGG